MDNIIYSLVLEKEGRPGDYQAIDISALDIKLSALDIKLLESYNIPLDYTKINIIDCFTSKYTEQQIKESIIRANVITDSSYLNGKLKIVSTKKHNLPVITSDVKEEIDSFMSSGIKELSFNDFATKIIDVLSTILGYESRVGNDEIHSYKDDLNSIKSTYSSGEHIEGLENFLSTLPYRVSRKFYLSIYNRVISKNKGFKLNRTKGEGK